jgi:hypothetical protein
MCNFSWGQKKKVPWNMKLDELGTEMMNSQCFFLVGQYLGRWVMAGMGWFVLFFQCQLFGGSAAKRNHDCIHKNHHKSP